MEVWKHSMETADWNILPLWWTAETHCFGHYVYFNLTWKTCTWVCLQTVRFRVNTDYKHLQNIPALWESGCRNICTPHTPPDSTFEKRKTIKKMPPTQLGRVHLCRGRSCQTLLWLQTCPEGKKLSQEQAKRLQQQLSINWRFLSA